MVKVALMHDGDERVAGNRALSTLIYIEKGSFVVTAAWLQSTMVEAGNMFIVPSKDTCRCQAVGDVRAYCFYFYPEEYNSLNYMRREFTKYLGLETLDIVNKLVYKPINTYLAQKFQQLGKRLHQHDHDYLYWRMEGECIMALLLNLHPVKDLAEMFFTLIKSNSDFQTIVYRLYTHVQNANELIELSGIPAGTFRRKFQSTFGTSVGKWLAFKRREKILDDLVNSDMPIKEIAKKYALTPNYLFNYCREHFNMTPTELRTSRTQPEIDEDIDLE